MIDQKAFAIITSDEGNEGMQRQGEGGNIN